jgi:hypothetical protein
VKKRISIDDFQFLAMRHVSEWKEFLAKKEKHKSNRVTKWTPPPEEWIKINSDGATGTVVGAWLDETVAVSLFLPRLVRSLTCLIPYMQKLKQFSRASPWQVI